MGRRFKGILLILLGLSLGLMGCRKGFKTTFSQTNTGSQGGVEVPITPIPDIPPDTEEPEPPPAGSPSTPSQPDPLADICPSLNFQGVLWPIELSGEEIEAFALGLNITGSFEGHSGWSNLSNNFDGQGVSMGLLNQNLGQNTLQPLLIAFSQHHSELGLEIFGASRWEKLLGMLNEWSGTLIFPSQTERMPSFFLNSKSLGEFVGADPNQDKYYQTDFGFQLQDAKAQRSVQWAVSNIYSDSQARTFKSEWRSAFKKLIVTPEYITLQIAAAYDIHQRTLKSYRQLEFDSLSAYLFLFDVVVQNGGLRNSHVQTYFDFREKNPSLGEEALLLQLMEIRVLSSLPQWREDVRRRKRAVITGSGVVHGSSRELQEEYCYSGEQEFL